MKNPLIRRLPRELKSDFGKYAVIFIFMVLMIGFVSGMMVTSGSLMKYYNNSFEECNIEDGNFELASKADEHVIDTLEKENVTIYENFYKERETDDIDSNLRIFLIREEVNLVSVFDGELPVNSDEIAIDRMYADNNDIKIGDTLSVGGKELTVSGFVALSDYSALYSSPSDMMFDAIKFGVAVMSDEGFEAMGESGFHYSYSWKYSTPPSDDIEAKKMAEEFADAIAANAPITQFIPMYSNQAIQFVGDDTGSDRMMFTVFLYIVVAIIAFIMAITTNNTIAKEANVIGTLRASGYTKSELIRHYLAMPLIVTVISAIVGNILGYTVFTDLALSIYYSNYSLPRFNILLNADAFVRTTVIPVILMFVINFAILASKMNLSPLKFIRRDLSRRQKKKSFRLNTKIGIMHRFRLRIIFQNLPNYITIVIGIFLANIIMLLGMGFPKLLDNNQKNIADNMFCNYQYLLKAPVETENDNAEKYCAGSLVTIEGRLKSEGVSLYGVNPDSKYINIAPGNDGVYISTAYSEKFKIEEGDSITLKEEFGTKKYTFKVKGTYDYPTSIAVFMSRQLFNETFELDSEYYNGYLSDDELSDIDEMLIGAKITEDDMNKMSRQLNRSMGGIMDIFYWFGIVMFMMIIYLLSKIIIEKNAQSISMTKILGYTNSEISGLYVISTSIVVVLSFILTMPLVDLIMRYVCEVMFSTFPGWMPYEVPFSVFVKIIVIGIIAYALIAFMQFGRVKKIPLDAVLKNVE